MWRELCRSLQDIKASMQQSGADHEKALESMTKRCSAHETTIKGLESKVQSLEDDRAQLQACLRSERHTAKLANDVSTNLDRMYKNLKKQADDDKAYYEACPAASHQYTSLCAHHLQLCLHMSGSGA
jgi:chromosome segregation ATPase